MIVNKVDGFCYTTAIKKLRSLKRKVRIVPGGTSAGKTYGIIPILIDTAIRNSNLEISIVSESIPHLRRGALKDFLKIMKSTGRFIEQNYNKTLLTYTFSSGSYIEFFSADQEGKVRGPRRHILYINECNNITFETYHNLAIRTEKTIWLDFNPTNEFWAHTELRDDKDAEWLTLTYKDNEALDESIINEIEKAKAKAYYNPDLEPPALFNATNIKNHYWHNWWKVYGIGELGILEGIIFKNWYKIKDIPDGSRLIGYGMDWGFTNDPTTIVCCYQFERIKIWKELLYQTGMTNGDIALKMRELGITKNDIVIADSSEPKSIAEVNMFGFNVRPAVKGPDSIKFGIDLLQREDIYVTEDSINLIKELRNYAWDQDKTGKLLNVPVDAYNHCTDPMRYLATGTMSKQKMRKNGLKKRN